MPAIAVLTAVLVHRGGFQIGPDGVLAHAWYNADWFKHLGHTHALLIAGMPPRDIFGGGSPLFYYWLYYPIPALGATIHGDVPTALQAAGIVQTASFWILLYGFIREVGSSPRAAALISLLGFILFSSDYIVRIAIHGMDPMFWTDFNVHSSFLFRLNFYIPQHQLLFSGLLSWALLGVIAPPTFGYTLRLLAHAPIVAASAVSTLLGAVCLGIFAAIKFLLPGYSLKYRLLSIPTVTIAFFALLFLLQVVDPSFGGATMASPAFTNPPPQGQHFERLARVIVEIVGRLSLGLPLGLLGFLCRARLPNEHGPMLLLATTFTCAGLGAYTLGHTLLPNARLAQELAMRAALPASIGLLAGIAMLTLHYRQLFSDHLVPVALIGVASLSGLVTTALDFVWHHRSSAAWRTHVPSDDLRVLTYLNHSSRPEALVLQYPEPPYLAGGGRDTWVPIFAGRTVLASDRSTNYHAAVPTLDVIRRFYSGEEHATVPPTANWIYLSRALHPGTYDTLQTRLTADPEWRKRLCLPDACLFERR